MAGNIPIQTLPSQPMVDRFRTHKFMDKELRAPYIRPYVNASFLELAFIEASISPDIAIKPRIFIPHGGIDTVVATMDVAIRKLAFLFSVLPNL
jgi:hypothetical protein